jgi:hypothetical protein
MLTPRPRDEIEAQYAKAWVMLPGTRRDGGTATVTQIVIAMAGVHEALGWVLGRTPWSPLSGRIFPPGPRNCSANMPARKPCGIAVACCLWYGPRLRGRHRHALSWARGAADATPPAG